VSLLRVGIALAAALAAIAISYAVVVHREERTARQGAATSESAATAPPQLPATPEAARADARVTLQRCVTQAERTARTSWDGMCAVLAQKNAVDFAGCRQQGRDETACRALYENVPAKDCLLPHAAADSVAQAAQAAKRECYEQFQNTVR
jgi:hypothetical protein